MRKALVHADATGLHVLNAFAVAPAIYANLLDEDLAAADVDLARMGKWLADTTEILDTAHFEMLSGWRALSAGDSITAHDHAQRAVRITQRIGAIYPACLCRYGLAHVLVKLGNYDTAQAEIQQARLNPSGAYGPWMNYQCDLLIAHLEFLRGRDNAAENFLRGALTLGRECGFSQPFWLRPTIMVELCARALEKDIETEHVHNLIRQRNLVLPVTGTTLSKRETEILMLIAKGLSRGEAAAALGIGVRIIATHVGSIYSKLDISSRAEATVEAIRMGLIQP